MKLLNRLLRSKVCVGTILFALATFTLYLHWSRNSNATSAVVATIPTPKPEDVTPPDLMPDPIPSVAFPKGFMWGTASSAYQTGGANPHSDWWGWEEKHDLTRLEEPTDDYHVRRWYERDVAEARGMQLTHHRTSVEWSQIEPQKGVWDKVEIGHFRNIFAAFKKNGIEPVICLHHFSLPKWLADEGGWENPRSAEYFARYAEKVATDIGKPLGIRMWLTFNEPLVPVMNGYLKGEYPPGKKNDWNGAVTVFRNFIKAHKAAYAALHRVCDTSEVRIQVGIAAMTSSFLPYSNSYADTYVARGLEILQNYYFFDATEDQQDFIGLNYYREFTIKFAWSTWFMSDYVKNEISPNGLYRLIKQFSIYGKPIIIMENGLNTSDEKTRIKFIAGHLAAIRRAMDEHIDVRGYFHWSLTDTYEWNQGYTTHFGFVGINRQTQDRIKRKSAHFFTQVIEQNGFDGEMIKMFLNSPEN